VNYEKYIKQIKSKKIESMNLLTGIIITLTNTQMDVFTKYKDYFKSLGFNIEDFGDREIKINTIPVVIGSLDKKEIFLEILDDLSLMPSFKDPEIILDKIASMSCKAAIKGHDRLSIKEQEYLIDELLKLENPYNCPHGRPTIIAMTKYELEKKFKRIV
jgi:DNA mismatch repair protein MutL